MDKLKAEIIINRIRILFGVFFLIAGFMARRSGSETAVYQGILIGSGVQFAVIIVNAIFLKFKKMPTAIIYISVTIELLNVFFVKVAFHYDSFNAWGLAIKEPSTTICFILYSIINGLRFNKRLNLYMGAVTILSYITLIMLGLSLGNMAFVKDPKLIFTPTSLRLPTELALVLFMIGNTYFLYLMAKFTTRNVRGDRESKADSR